MNDQNKDPLETFHKKAYDDILETLAEVEILLRKKQYWSAANRIKLALEITTDYAKEDNLL